MATRQNISLLFSGNHVDITVTVEDGNTGLPKNLSGTTAVVWSLSTVKGEAAVLSKSLGSGITITDAPNGKFVVALVPADTESLAGSYYHEGTIKDGSGKVATVVYGTCTVEKNTNQVA